MALTVTNNWAAGSVKKTVFGQGGGAGAGGGTFSRLLAEPISDEQLADDGSTEVSVHLGAEGRIREANLGLQEANNSIALVQVTDDALAKTESMLQRIQSASSQGAEEDGHWQEVNHMISEIDDLVGSTEFGGVKPLDGDLAEMGVVIPGQGEHAVPSHLSLNTMSAIALGLEVTASREGMASLAQRTVKAIQRVSGMRGGLQQAQSGLQEEIAGLNSLKETAAAVAAPATLERELAREASGITRNIILQQAGSAILAHTNQHPALAFELLDESGI